jgi:hypothetical protein
VTLMPDNFSSVSRIQVTEAYLQAIRLIDDRVTPFLGKATTRVLVQCAAKRVMDTHPTFSFLSFFVTMPYTEVVPSVINEQFSGVTVQELVAGLDALLDECFAGLKELTGNIIAPPLHDEVTDQLRQLH